MRLTRFVLIAFAASGMAFAAPAFAQPAPGAAAAPSVSPEVAASLKQAHAMAEMLNVPQQIKGLMQAMRNQMVQATIQASGKSVEEAAKIVDEVLMPDFNASVPDLTEAMLQPWANNFTAADLKGLQEFYSTPLGQKLLKTVPLVGQQVAQATQIWGQRTFHEAVQKHTQELHDRGLKF
jgi:hypothetical protein